VGGAFCALLLICVCVRVCVHIYLSPSDDFCFGRSVPVTVSCLVI